MTTADYIFVRCRSAGARTDGVSPLKTAQQPAGPFEVPTQTRKPTARDALVTGLLVIYPAFAAVAAIIAGLFLTGAGSL